MMMMTMIRFGQQAKDHHHQQQTGYDSGLSHHAYIEYGYRKSGGGQ